MKYIFFILCSFTLVSCAPFYYIPNQLNMPLANEAKDSKIALYTGTGGWGGEASYALNSHMLILANGIYNNFSTIGRNQTFSYDAGGGYYRTLEYNLNLEVIGGIGYGRTDADIKIAPFFSAGGENEEDILHSSYTRCFFQVDLSRTNWKGVVIGYGLRIGAIFPEDFSYRQILSTTHFVGNGGQSPTTIISDNTINSAEIGFFAEPAIQFSKYVGTHTYFHSSIGISYCTNQNMVYGYTSNIITWPLMATLGFTFVF